MARRRRGKSILWRGFIWILRLWWQGTRRLSVYLLPKAILPRQDKREPVPNGVRFSIFERDGFKCRYCGKGVEDGRKLHLDHYKPWWKVRSHDPANFVTSCDHCNLGKGGRIMKQPIEDFVR